MKINHSTWLTIAWSTIVIGSFSWNYYLIKQNNLKVVKNKSRAFFEQVLITRSWNSQHGGVYVPITEKTEPNQYLIDSLRDITTKNGLELTKINPAFMTRQISELNKSTYKLQFHMTSLEPINPKNKPDEWEIEALKSFGENNKEILNLVEKDSILRYRYMAPLYVEQSCLKCHENQGYRLGELRGGISVSFPAKLYLDPLNRQKYSLFLGHLIVLVLGIFGIKMYYRKSNRLYSVIKKKNIELEINEEAILLTNKYLSELNAKKDKLFSIIAHDLRSPFSSIAGLSKILIDEKRDIDKKKEVQILRGIHDTIEKSYSLLENLLLWARAEMKKNTFKLEKLNIQKVAEENIQLHGISALNKFIDIKNNISKELIINADKNMLNTVLRNLISNAIKFSNTNGEIEISAYNKNESCILSVKDNGVGMTKQQLDSLFNIAEVETTPGTYNETGSGLGLILCKEFVEKHHGKIWVESEVNTGSQFSFSIPEIQK